MRRPRLSGDRVDSRWWYWIAAVPTVFAFWLVTVAWVFLAISMDPDLFFAFDGPSVVHAGLVSLVAVGIPFVVLTVLFPLAVFQDAEAIARAELDWNPSSENYAFVALLGVAVLAGIALVDLSLGVVSGFVVSVPFALYYLRKRHEHVGVP